MALVAAAGSAPLEADPEEVYGTVAYVAEDAVYVDLGSESGLRSGDLGVVRRAGAQVATIEVVSTTKRQARVRILRQTDAPAAGDRVIIKVRRSGPPGEAVVPDVGPKDIDAPEAFVPLLERQRLRAEAVPPQNIFHGRVSVTQLVQLDGYGDLGYATTLLGTHGMLDRINGTPWAVRWSGNASYRAGDAFSGTGLGNGRLDVFNLEARRRLGNDGRLRLGRFVPQGLGAAGYIDGIGIDIPSGTRLRLGGAAGFKPTRENLTPSLREPTALAYMTLESPEGANLMYSGSTGLYGSAYRGRFDRLALMTEQFVSTGPLRANATAEIDFDVGDREFNPGTRLTRLDAYGSYRVSSALTLRAGADYYERLDTAAERDMLTFLDPMLFQNNFWRYWAGFGLSVPGRLRIDAELGRIQGGADSSNPNWRVSLSHHDPLGAVGGFVSLTLYNLESFQGSGLGGLLSGHIPLGAGRWFLRPGLGLRSFDQPGIRFELTDAHLHVDFAPTPEWEIRGGLAYLTGTAVDSMLLEIGLGYRW